MTKRKGLFLTLFLIVFIFCLSTASMAEEQYNMEVSYGISNTAKPGKSLRVRTKVTGDFGEDFHGILRIAPTSDYAGNARFDIPVSADADGVISSDIYIPLVTDSDSMRVSLMNEQADYEYTSTWVDFDLYKNEQECVTGVFSEDPQDLKFLEDASMRYGSLKLKEVAIDKADIPSELKGYDIFDLVIVSDYPLGELTDKQFSALNRYVENGGILLLDGNNPESNFGEFYEELIESPSDLVADITISNIADSMAVKPGDEEIRVSAVDLNIRDGISIVQGDRFPAMYYVRKGLGRVVITTFAIPEINYYCEKDSSFAETFLSYVLGDEKIEELMAEDSFGFSDFYYSIRNLVGTGSLRRLPSVNKLGIVIMVYVLIIGPVLHGILKSFGKEKYYLSSAALFAIICTGIIYLIGSGTRFTDTFFTYSRILDISDGEKMEDAYVNIRSPFDEGYSAELSGNYDISPIPVREAYEVKGKANREKNTITFYEDHMNLKLYPSETFESQIFRLQKEWGESKEGILVNAEYQDTEDGILVTGTAESQMSGNLDNAVLLLWGRAVLIGSLEPGQVIPLEEMEQINYPLGDTLALAKQITGNVNMSEAVMSGNATGIVAQDRMRVLEFFFDSQKQKQYDKPVILGFIPEKDEEKPEFLNRAKSVEGISMIISKTEMEDASSETVFPMPEGSIRVISGIYDAYTNTMINDVGEPLVMEYDLGDLSALEKIRVEYLSECFDEDAALLTPEFAGEIMFFNHETGNFTRMEDKEEFTLEELRDYLSPSCGLTVRYNPDFNRDISWEMALPMFYIINSQKK